MYLLFPGKLMLSNRVLKYSRFLQDEKPDKIFLPQTGDTHETHRAVVKAILMALQQILFVTWPEKIAQLI